MAGPTCWTVLLERDGGSLNAPVRYQFAVSFRRHPGGTQQVPLHRITTRSFTAASWSAVAIRSAHTGYFQIVGDINNRCQDRRFPFFERQLPHHPLTRFHGIQRESGEGGEPSHVSTEIIKGKPKAALLHFCKEAL